MRHTYVFALFCAVFVFFFSKNEVLAQAGCPGCVLNLPAGLAVDTVYLPPLPDGQQGVPYNQDISFRLPKTTTPVAAIDSTTPPGLTISELEILSVQGLPPGLNWEASQTVFPVATETDGCIKICGTPLTSDSFVLTVVLKATVFIIVQETSFPVRLYIAPSSTVTEGFSMTGNVGCGSTTVTFVNNVPSGGQPGFSYTWDFGDSSDVFLGENPPPHVYNQPGVYPVTYHATIDTSGYTLASVRILDVDCVDQLGLGTPDLYVRITDPNGQLVFEQPSAIDNASLPLTVPINLLLTDGNYLLEVWDEDAGLKGGDDFCGSVPFNLLSNDTLTSAGFAAVLTIVHPVSEVNSTDTVQVYPQPAPPLVLAPLGTSACADAVPLLLQSSYSTGNQWFANTESILNATDSLLEVSQSGSYVVQYTSPDGCIATSDATLIDVLPQPSVPTFVNNNNRLRLLDTMALPDQYSLQWLRDSVPIDGENGFTYCTTESGNYGLQVFDWETGCQNFYFLTTTLNPAFDCTVGVADGWVEAGLRLYPNPAHDRLTLELDAARVAAPLVRWHDAQGRQVSVPQHQVGSGQWFFEVGRLPAGLYAVSIFSEQKMWTQRVVVR
jgi:hypothetical protein